MDAGEPSFHDPPRLRIVTGDTSYRNAPTVELTSPSTGPSGGTHASQIATPRLSDASRFQSFNDKITPSPSYRPPATSAPNPSKALNESRKLLAHLLSQLQNRPLPPPVFDAFKDIGGNLNDTKLAEVVQTVRAVVRLKGGKKDMRAQPSASQRDDSDEEDEMEKTFTTDTTFSLMSQLKDVLLISRLQNWQIFYDRYGGLQRSGNANFDSAT
jgi:hypothetical protein